MAEGSDFDIDVDPQRSHKAPHGAHEAEDGYVPHIVEHARAVECQAVGVQPEIAVSPKVRAQDVLRMLLWAGHKQQSQCLVAQIVSPLRRKNSFIHDQD